jgi:hypothetical protein
LLRYHIKGAVSVWLMDYVVVLTESPLMFSSVRVDCISRSRIIKQTATCRSTLYNFHVINTQYWINNVENNSYELSTQNKHKFADVNKRVKLTTCWSQPDFSVEQYEECSELSRYLTRLLARKDMVASPDDQELLMCHYCDRNKMNWSRNHLTNRSMKKQLWPLLVCFDQTSKLMLSLYDVTCAAQL